jgi:hypothetical protein
MKTIDISHHLVLEFEFPSIKVENSDGDALGAADMAIPFLRNRGNNSHQEHTGTGLLVGITCIKAPDDNLMSFGQGHNSLAFRGRRECREFGPPQWIE